MKSRVVLGVFGRPRLRAALLATALVLVATVHGRIVDVTTGQPLAHVTVDVFAGSDASGKRLARAVTDADGTFALHGLRSGSYALSLSSDDVPRAVESIRVDAAHPHALELRACSTTLDYSCAPKFDVPREGGSNG